LRGLLFKASQGKKVSKTRSQEKKAGVVLYVCPLSYGKKYTMEGLQFRLN
jgi:hypothetical protein